jgi:hypothetical protein
VNVERKSKMRDLCSCRCYARVVLGEEEQHASLHFVQTQRNTGLLAIRQRGEVATDAQLDARCVELGTDLLGREMQRDNSVADEGVAGHEREGI